MLPAVPRAGPRPQPPGPRPMAAAAERPRSSAGEFQRHPEEGYQRLQDEEHEPEEAEEIESRQVRREQEEDHDEAEENLLAVALDLVEELGVVTPQRGTDEFEPVQWRDREQVEDHQEQVQRVDVEEDRLENLDGRDHKTAHGGEIGEPQDGLAGGDDLEATRGQNRDAEVATRSRQRHQQPRELTSQPRRVDLHRAGVADADEEDKHQPDGVDVAPWIEAQAPLVSRRRVALGPRHGGVGQLMQHKTKQERRDQEEDVKQELQGIAEHRRPALLDLDTTGAGARAIGARVAPEVMIDSGLHAGGELPAGAEW